MKTKVLIGNNPLSSHYKLSEYQGTDSLYFTYQLTLFVGRSTPLVQMITKVLIGNSPLSNSTQFIFYLLVRIICREINATGADENKGANRKQSIVKFDPVYILLISSHYL